MNNIARKGSGAYLNGTLYREWHDKVKSHDSMKLLLEKVARIDVDGQSAEHVANLATGYAEEARRLLTPNNAVSRDL
jgi:hypothetical protein